MESQLKKTEYDQGHIFNIKMFKEYETIERELAGSLSNSEGIIREMCYHFAGAGGKRIRPLLILYVGRLFTSAENTDLLKVAVAAELIHMASLVHDDIIDESVLRKNKPSVNCLWGNHYAVLCGDYLFAKAFSLLSDAGSLPGMKYMIEAIQSMCHGEVLQASEKFDLNTNLNMYYNKIAKKTARFLECCCKAGAAIAGAEEFQVILASQFGLNLGYAFQIEDDILDFCGDPAVMGKPACEDLRQGNLTLPVLLLMDKERYGNWIRELVHSRSFTDSDLAKVRMALEESGIIKESLEISKYHLEKARNALKLLPVSIYRDKLLDITDMLKSRVN